MGFQTYTCCICGKSGLTKRNSYFIEGKGRACREHEQAQDANSKREQEREAKIQKLNDLKLLLNVSSPIDKSLPIYQMHQFCDSYELNLLMNLRLFTIHHLAYDEKASLDHIFNSSDHLNNFHPNFDRMMDELMERQHISSSDGGYDDVVDAARKTYYDICNEIEGFDEASCDDVYRHCIEKVDEFIKFNCNELQQIEVEEDKMKAFSDNAVRLFNGVKFEIARYENSDMAGKYEKLNILIKYIKALLGDIHAVWFKAYNDISYDKAYMILYAIVTKEYEKEFK